MKQKKGISLIVLVITIIVIIILASIIIISISKNNPIGKAKEAVDASDLKNAEYAVSTYIANRWTEDKNNDGVIGDEVGSSYSGTITKSPSNLEINKDGNVQIEKITLEDLGLGMLDEVVIANSGVTSIKKGNNTYNSNGTTSGSNTGTSSGTTGGISSADYTALLNRISTLETDSANKANEINTLKADSANKDQEINTLKADMQAIQASAITKKVIYEGTADVEGATYSLKAGESL